MKILKRVPRDARSLSHWARQTFQVVDHSAVTIARFPMGAVAGFSKRDEGASIYLLGSGQVSQKETNLRLAIHQFYPTASIEQIRLSLSESLQLFKRFASGVYVRPDLVRHHDPHGRWLTLCTGISVSLEGSADQFPIRFSRSRREHLRP